MTLDERPASSTPRLIERLGAGLNADGMPVLLAANPTKVPLPPTGHATTLRAEPDPVQPSAPTLARSSGLSHGLLEETGMVALRRRSHVSEEFRIARHHVLEMLKRPPSDDDRSRHQNIVLVTSARQGEGKSFAALNLAGLLAEGSNRDVVLIDADIGHASLTARFNLANAPGLLEFGQPIGQPPGQPSSQSSVPSPRQLARTIPVGTDIERLIFIPVGGSANIDARSRLAAERSICQLIAQVVNSFDDAIIVVDAPACLTTSDPTELSVIAGQVVLVVEAGQTRHADIEQSLDLLDSCPQLSLLLNRAPKRRRGDFFAKG